MSAALPNLRLLLTQNAFKIGKFSINQATYSVPNRCIARWVAPTLIEFKRREKRFKLPKTTPRNTFPEWNFRAELYSFGKRLNEEFDEELLQQAFTQRSFIIQEEMRQKALGIEEPELNLKDNRELVEKGSEIINKYVKAFLKYHLPKYPAEGIAGVQNWLCSDAKLAYISKNLGTTAIILGEEDYPSEETYAQTFKAIIGALAESTKPKTGNIDAAYNFVRDFVCVELNQEDVNELWTINEPYKMLEKLCAENGIQKLIPRIISETGKNTILATCYIGIYDANTKKLLGAGYGDSYSNGTDLAAIDALVRIFGTKNLKPFNYQISVKECFSENEKERLRVAST